MRKAVESYLQSNGYNFCRHSENQGVLRVKLQKWNVTQAKSKFNIRKKNYIHSNKQEKQNLQFYS